MSERCFVSWLDVALAIPMALLLIRVCWSVLKRTCSADHIATYLKIHAEGRLLAF